MHIVCSLRRLLVLNPACHSVRFLFIYLRIGLCLSVGSEAILCWHKCANVSWSSDEECLSAYAIHAVFYSKQASSEAQNMTHADAACVFQLVCVRTVSRCLAHFLRAAAAVTAPSLHEIVPQGELQSRAALHCRGGRDATYRAKGIGHCRLI